MLWVDALLKPPQSSQNLPGRHSPSFSKRSHCRSASPFMQRSVSSSHPTCGSISMRPPGLSRFVAVLPEIKNGKMRLFSIILAIFICSGLPSSDVAAKTVRLSGIVFTLGTDQTQTLWPNARVSLKNQATGREVSTVSDDLGQYSFAGIPPGDYELSVTLAGFATRAKQITLSPDESGQKVDVQLTPQKQSE